MYLVTIDLIEKKIEAGAIFEEGLKNNLNILQESIHVCV